MRNALAASAIDVVGSHTLANVCAALRYRGVVAACGLAGIAIEAHTALVLGKAGLGQFTDASRALLRSLRCEIVPVVVSMVLFGVVRATQRDHWREALGAIRQNRAACGRQSNTNTLSMNEMTSGCSVLRASSGWNKGPSRGRR